MGTSGPGPAFADDEPDPLGALLTYLELSPGAQADTYTARSVPQVHGRVYGGQVLAQSMIAAAATTAPGRLPHSVHGYFLRPGDLEEPITFTVERLRDGRSFSARRVHALQFGKPILTMMSSFQEDQEGVEHADRPPRVPEPEELPSSVEMFRTIEHPLAQYFYRNFAFDVRHVEGGLFLGEPTRPEPAQHLWMRTRGPVPGDQMHHRAVLAYACDQIMLEPVLRAHSLHWRARGIAVASLDHAMWWHRDVDMNDWLLYVQDSPSAQGGRGLGTARVYNRDGLLVATIAQEGMVRGGD
ncbi:acyl-CoA thioesterase [Pseudactinotalea sp. Z1739]|uniref:acyl-CoA thioesterase n=1 Tax=Pseudactinotalea sp. Z1739 TaxID=3413028 RepID=UPI003C7D1F7A